MRWLTVLVGGLALGVGLWLLGLATGVNPLPYVFYLRFALFFAALLVFFPLICTRLFPTLLANVLELRGPWQFVLCLFSAVALGMAAVRTGATASFNLSCRFLNPELCLSLEAAGEAALAPVFTVPFLTYAGTALLLALPLGVSLVRRSRALQLYWSLPLALGLITLTLTLYGFVVAQDYLRPLSLGLANLLEQGGPGVQAGYLSRTGEGLDERHLEAAVFLMFALGVYVGGYRWFRPNERRHVPALFYILLLSTMLCLFLGGVAFWLDYYRVPTLLFFLLLSFASYYVWRTDHYYKLFPAKGPKPGVAASLRAVQERLSLQASPDKTLVVVSCAGGGIQASAWTVKVLTEIERALGSEFSRAVCLLSAASGGSVGVMHYLDRFGTDGSLDAAQLEPLYKSSMENNLDAVGWGLAYPDFLRLVGLPLRSFIYTDRGSELEDDWGRQLLSEEASFGDWQEAILAGQKPIPVFNATLVEDGRRYLLSPLSIQEPFAYKSLDFNTLYPGHDIRVKTATRLSATFPYVTPISRNAVGEAVYHVADGGYFDNFGVFTAVNWLDDLVLPKARDLNIRRVLFLEIRAFPQAQEVDEVPPYDGWIMQLLGPLITLFNMRGSTQTARNFVELSDLRGRWNGVPLGEDETLTFEQITLDFPREFQRRKSREGDEAFKDEAGRYAPPLSWKLSEDQKLALDDAWTHVLEQDEQWAKLLALDWFK